MAGRFLVAPQGTKLTPERVNGWLWQTQAENRLRNMTLKRSASSSKLTFLPPRERFDGQA